MSTTFDLVVRTATQGIRTLDVVAADAAEAYARAAQEGWQVLSCVPRKAAKFRGSLRAGSSASGLDITSFSYEFASLLSAGLSVIEGLRTLAAKERTAARRSTLLELSRGVSQGLPLSTALAQTPDRFPPLLIATVSASEQTGDLSVSLRRYAEHQQSVRALRDKVVGATIYPMLLLVVGCLVVFFLLTIVVPKFALLIEGTHRELPWSSQLMMSWGQFAAAHSWEIAVFAVAAAMATAVLVRRTMQTGARARWVEVLPFIGPTIRRFRHAQLYRTTGMLVRGGIASPRALALAASLLGDSDRARLDQALRMIREGRGLSAALLAVDLADPVATSMLAVAERTGALAEILERIAQFHESGLQRSIELASRLFEPVLMIVIGLVIGGIVVLMYLPIFDLASSLQ